MTVSCEETTEEISFPTKESKNRRTLSESDVNRQKNVEKSVHPPAASAPSRNPMSNNISSSRNVTEDFQQKRSHSLPHRYKIPHLAIRSNVTPTRQKCVSPQEFRRGIQAMQSWFHNLNDTQRTLALQSITVRQISFTYAGILC